MPSKVGTRCLVLKFTDSTGNGFHDLRNLRAFLANNSEGTNIPWCWNFSVNNYMAPGGLFPLVMGVFIQTTFLLPSLFFQKLLQDTQELILYNNTF